MKKAIEAIKRFAESLYDNDYLGGFLKGSGYAFWCMVINWGILVWVISGISKLANAINSHEET